MCHRVLRVFPDVVEAVHLQHLVGIGLIDGAVSLQLGLELIVALVESHQAVLRFRAFH